MYRVSGACLFLLLAAFSACAADTKPIRVPDVAPVPNPLPQPSPGAPLILSLETVLMVDSDVPVIVLTSPDGFVTVTEEAGPIRVRARFAEDPTKVQTKTFSGKHVFTIEPLKSGRIELLVVPVGATKASDVVRRPVQVEAGQGPIPPPKPDPKPEPIKLDVAWVILVEESADRKPETARLIGDKAYWDAWEAKGVKMRPYDDDSPDAKAKGYDKFAAEVGFPAALFLDKTGKVVAKQKITGKQDIDSVLSGGK